MESYHSFYAGFEYFLCGDNLKLMVGYEYLTADTYANPNIGLNDLGGISGDNVMIGIRAHF